LLVGLPILAENISLEPFDVVVVAVVTFMHHIYHFLEFLGKTIFDVEKQIIFEISFLQFVFLSKIITFKI